MVVNRTVLVCQHNACRKAGAKQVLAAFQKSSLSNASLSNVKIEPIRCLGQCGNGPMVVVLPEQIWYSKVESDKVAAVVEQHLQNGKPIQAMLYPKFHANR